MFKVSASNRAVLPPSDVTSALIASCGRITTFLERKITKEATRTRSVKGNKNSIFTLLAVDGDSSSCAPVLPSTVSLIPSIFAAAAVFAGGLAVPTNYVYIPMPKHPPRNSIEPNNAFNKKDESTMLLVGRGHKVV